MEHLPSPGKRRKKIIFDVFLLFICMYANFLVTLQRFLWLEGRKDADAHRRIAAKKEAPTTCVSASRSL